MKYNVFLYERSGRAAYSKEVEAKSHLQALHGIGTRLAYKMWDHAAIVGKKTVRYNKYYKKMDDSSPHFYSLTDENKKPIIMVMIGNSLEIYEFPYVENRNKKFEEILCLTKCTTSAFAGSAKIVQEPKDTTVFSEETDGTKSGLMSPKTLSGSAKNATWQDLLTPALTGKSSGTVKLTVTEDEEWSYGSTHSPSKQSRTFLGTVLNLRRANPNEWPGTNGSMMKMIGKTYEFSHSLDGKAYKASGWFFKPEWVDTQKIVVKIKGVKRGTVHICNNGEKAHFDSNCARNVGKVVELKKCGCGCGLYYEGNKYYAKEWFITGVRKQPQYIANLDKSIAELKAVSRKFFKVNKATDDFKNAKITFAEFETQVKEAYADKNMEVGRTKDS